MPDLDDMERQVHRDRERFRRALDGLSETVDADNIAEQMTGLMEDYGEELGRQAWQTARANPAAFALVGAGLALLLSGTGQRRDADDGGKVAPADTPRDTPQDPREPSDMTDVPSRADRMRETLHTGLDRLDAEAKARVLDARKAALHAQETIERRGRDTIRRPRTFHHEHPLAAGALALGVGALVGALLPSTKKEDGLMGAERDRLMARAQEALRAELASLGVVSHDRTDHAAPRDGH